MNTNKKTLISISVPVLNEEKNINILYDRLDKLSQEMKKDCDMEFIFSDNNSTDETWNILSQLARIDERVKAIKFSKNFGFQRSILANYLHTNGDAVMQIDADLQDPPELLKKFFQKWKDGYQVVYGIREKRPEGKLMVLFRKCGYWLIDKMSEHPIPKDAGDFRLIDRKVIQQLAKIKSASPYLRGMISNLGFKQIGIKYDRNERFSGNSKFSIYKVIRLGITAVINHSTVPLRAASFLGLIILGISFLGACYYFILKMMYPELPQGIASIHILVLFGIGLNSFFLGIIGEYILRIYLVLRSEPIAIVEKSLNIEISDKI